VFFSLFFVFIFFSSSFSLSSSPAYLTTQGVSTNNHPVTKELVRRRFWGMKLKKKKRKKRGIRIVFQFLDIYHHH